MTLLDSPAIFGGDTPVLAPTLVRIHCTGRRKNGELCNQLLARIDADLFEAKTFAGKLELKCPRCHTVAVID